MEDATRQIVDTDYLKDVFERAFRLLSVAWLDGEDYKPCVLHINNMVTDDGRARRSSMESESDYEASIHIVDEVLYVRLSWEEAQKLCENGDINKVFYDWGDTPDENLHRWIS